ncbi:PREDICTED: transmembrane protein 174 [Apaloderma vittatum]|uniref:Transmembrane protein 174 n=1 Tax=Apaloderma vittatum TaxID=57397 RepID=A0A091PGY3_APAVI|nr:PREDICTED: transmembrane protein 174 [Apaloderma vittatum]KFP90745.1 Transmembrane protein 174 [Apaloderma vittatum]
MEQNNNSVEDFSLSVFSVTPYQPNRPDVLVSDGDKAGATLLFSGVFLGLVGITFTVMGWIKYDGITHLEWTQLLGPILLSVGVTFILIAVCKFNMLTCKPCKERGENTSDLDQAASGQSFVFTGINQPITFHGATVVQYIPPPYPAQEGIAVSPGCLHPVLSCCSAASSSASQVPNSGSAHFCPAYPLDNSAFTGDENYATSPVETTRNQRSEDSADEPEELLEDYACDDLSPPRYEEIYPQSS